MLNFLFRMSDIYGLSGLLLPVRLSLTLLSNPRTCIRPLLVFQEREFNCRSYSFLSETRGDDPKCLLSSDTQQSAGGKLQLCGSDI